MTAYKDHPYSEAVITNGLVCISGCLLAESDGPLGDAVIKTVERWLQSVDEPRPAHAVIGVSTLPYNGKVDIDAIARRSSRRAGDLMRRHTERTREIYHERRQEAEGVA